ISPSQISVTPGYFEAIGARLARGRFFDDRDNVAAMKQATPRGEPTAPGSMIVDETLAKRFWPNQDPIGRRMYKPSDVTAGDLTRITDKTVFFTVVGVIADLKLHDLTEGAKSVGAYYFAMDQDISS